MSRSQCPYRVCTLLVVALIATCAMGSPAAAQEIIGRQAKLELLAKARAQLDSTPLPGVSTMSCKVYSRSLKALYDSLWAAAPDSIRRTPHSYSPPTITGKIDEPLGLMTGDLEGPPYGDAPSTFGRKLLALEPYANLVFGFWLQWQFVVRTNNTDFRATRDREGYTLDWTDKDRVDLVRLTPGYLVRSMENTTMFGERIRITPAYTRLRNRRRLASIRIDVTDSNSAAIGFLAIRYVYGSRAGHSVPTSATVTAQHIIPIFFYKHDDVPIDETLTFGDYQLIGK